MSVPDLERELRNLGGAVEFPPTPDLAAAVRRRLVVEQRPRRAFASRRALVVAFAVLVVAVGAVMAVPSARTAILEFFGLRGVTIERVPTSPATATGERAEVPEATLALGEEVSLAEARRRAAYDVLDPPTELGDPDRVYFSEFGPGGQVAYLYGDEKDVQALVIQFSARLEEGFIQKSAGPETRIEPVRVNGGPGWWLEGKPHEFVYLDPATDTVRPETLRLATNTLLWEQGERTLRIEGDLTKAEALAIAASMR